MDRRSFLTAQGAKLQPFTTEVLQASCKAAMEVYDETAARKPNFKDLRQLQGFRGEWGWFQVTEFHFDHFMIQRLSERA